MKPHWKVNKKQIGLIHVARAHLVASGVLTEVSYRDCLAIYGAGAKHANELTQEQANELLQHFQNCGWVYIPKVKKAPALSKLQRNKQIHLEAIQTALAALGKDWAYAEGIARRMKFPRKLEWCSPEQLHKVQIALTYQERRDAGDPPEPREETLAKRRERGKRHVE
ncbi:MAG: DUF1018 domain-containing protein [Deltaproteobacteria bacterium]|nr:DUF1018 domain-containing protein [Deltaproteobacteria bacterium]